MKLWRIGVDAPEYEADDMTGKGAEVTGGRWNRPGHPVIYTSTSISLAALETAVNLNSSSLPLNRFVVAITVPPDLWDDRETLDNPRVGWNAIPHGKVSLDYGDAWLQRCNSALLVVPSVIVNEELNILINPRHPDAARISAEKIRPWSYDGRLRPRN